MVFDSGDDVSHSVPVFEGYCLPHAVQRFPLAGGDVTMHLKKVFTSFFLLFTVLGCDVIGQQIQSAVWLKTFIVKNNKQT